MPPSSRKKPPPASPIDAYIAAARPDVRPILEELRRVIAAAAPDAEETISYRIPAFRQHGILVYFAAFKAHIGFYPPVSGDARLVLSAARYAGPKGNLRFPLSEPIPYALVRRIVRNRVKQDRKRAALDTKRRGRDG